MNPHQLATRTLIRRSQDTSTQLKDLSGVSGVYEEIHDYEAITVKPPPLHEVQQQPLPPPALPAAAPMVDQECKLTPCPAYIPTTFPGNKDTDADGEYANVDQSSKEAIEEEYDYIEVSHN